MMRRYVYDDSQRVKDWVSARIPGAGFGPDDTAIGFEVGGEIVGGVVYTHYCGSDIRMHVAGSGRWLSREFLYRAFAYPFLQLGCRRVSGLVREDNLRARKFDEKLGFVREGLLRDADDDGTNLIVYGMLRSECKWIKPQREVARIFSGQLQEGPGKATRN